MFPLFNNFDSIHHAFSRYNTSWSSERWEQFKEQVVSALAVRDDAAAQQLVAPELQRLKEREGSLIACELYTQACKSHCLETAKFCLDLLPSHALPLQIACRHGFLELLQDAQFWSDSGRFTNTVLGTSPLHCVCMCEDSEADFSSLLKDRISNGRRRKQALVQLLVEKGYPLQDKDAYGASPFHYSCLHHDLEMINFLEKNYRATCRFRAAVLSKGLSYLHLLATSPDSTEAFLHQSKETKSLKDMLLHRDHCGRTILHYACKFGEPSNSYQLACLIKRVSSCVDDEDASMISPLALYTQKDWGSLPQPVWPARQRPRPLYSWMKAGEDTYRVITNMRRLKDRLSLPSTRSLNTYGSLTQEQRIWMQTACRELISSIKQHWMDPQVKQELLSLLTQQAGVRAFFHNPSAYNRDLIFEPISQFLHASGDSELARLLADKVSERIGLVPSKTLCAQRFTPLDFGRVPALLALRNIFISHTLRELDQLPVQLEKLFSDEPKSCQVRPAYFLTVGREARIYPLLLQKEMPSGSWLAVGADKEGSAQLVLQEIFSEWLFDKGPFVLTADRCRKLLTAHRTNMWGFDLFAREALNQLEAAIGMTDDLCIPRVFEKNY